MSSYSTCVVNKLKCQTEKE